MFALVFPELLDLLGMAAHAGIGHIVAEGYLERSVWVPVAAQATIQFKVGFPGVALTTLGNIILGLWAMGSVTVEACDCFVACP
jgi:hypothetical protein